MLKQIEKAGVFQMRRRAVDAETLSQAAAIVGDVRENGEAALRRHAERLGDIEAGARFVIDKSELERAYEGLTVESQQLLHRVAERIRDFAEAQRASVAEIGADIPGGKAGHRIAPVETAGCYAPGGRYPLPSSMLMTAVTARAAGVQCVWAASPRPSQETLAAAHVAGVDGLLAVGGAQAIAAMAFGVGIPACDAVVGPGNRWVTAAKQLVSGTVAIDMLAGPSELVILADDSADSRVVAADLLAQAEHDPDAIPILVTISADLAASVSVEIERQLVDLPTAAVATQALANGGFILADSVDEAISIVNQLAPEHLEVLGSNFEARTAELKHFGGLFIGAKSAEVFGDYGAGPNHTLPTGGTARSFAGLSVFTFLRFQTWMRIEEANGQLIDDTADMARMEGLEAHARAAEIRRNR